MSSSTAAGLGLAVTTGIIVLYVVIVLAIWVLYIIGFWKMFAKAGEPGWKAIIPVYNLYIGYKISWTGYVFWIVLLCAVVSGICSSFDNSTILVVISGLLDLVCAVLHIIQCYKMAKAFGRGVGTCIGLIFLNPIFVMILGFGSARYIGPQIQNR